MKKILLILNLIVVFHAFGQTTINNAKQQAKEQHRLILLNFSGSDWCVPCIKMHKTIFENETYKQMADSLLVYVNADFPRKKKNQPLSQTIKENEALAEQYNPGGAFPYTLLLDEDGKVLKTWEGLPKVGVEGFTNEIITQYKKVRK
ncbi:MULTISPECIES: thioredoxin family protein [Sphingobacterium]|uniref:thioredoxin family protein n=1 Tax=Sphingobacterium TaxID=28453 RepID=UPI00038A19B3|nr:MULTISPECIES: thioredoxin family protein [Sphingobacterium]KKX48481.1 thioredoxin disulfide isomerase [Sphingobacterium sp. IITKGP-BTPF85]MBB1645448.1 thiol-disulfide isomerase [Sphingobacterium sp. UME9]QQT43514.1 thioredoxin family protein [Sphingobacterium multivorum]SUI97992.1 Disulfide bond reductase DsbH precursor [Sphingobacterium multivorum]